MGKASKKTVLLCGSEGAGKTTLVKLMGMLQDTDSQDVADAMRRDDDEQGSGKKEEELVIKVNSKNMKDWGDLRNLKPSQGLDIHKIAYKGSKLKVWDISGKPSVGWE